PQKARIRNDRFVCGLPRRCPACWTPTRADPRIDPAWWGRPLQKQRLLAKSGLGGLVCGLVFGAEGGQARMVQAIATDEMDHQQEEQGSKDQDSRGGLQADLQVADVRNAPDQQRPERAQELR